MVTSSLDDHTDNRPARHSRTPTSVADSRHRAHRDSSAKDGRTTAARRLMAAPDATRAMSTVEATPALRRLRAPQRVTVAEVRDHLFQAASASRTPTMTSTGQGTARARVTAGSVA